MARSAVKSAFSTKPSRVYKYDKILALAMWHFDGKILNVNTEDLHNDAKELHRPEDYCTGKAKIYSRPCRHDQWRHGLLAKDSRRRRRPSTGCTARTAAAVAGSYLSAAAAAGGDPSAAAAAGGDLSTAAAAGGDPPGAAAMPGGTDEESRE